MTKNKNLKKIIIYYKWGWGNVFPTPPKENSIFPEEDCFRNCKSGFRNFQETSTKYYHDFEWKIQNEKG